MDYVIGQMSKMQTNSYAAYVVNRIINLLDDLSLKFVTQQLIRKSDHKIALTDLYFPQIEVHVTIVDVDYSNKNTTTGQRIDLGESQQSTHLRQLNSDIYSDEDIINIVGHRILKIHIAQDKAMSIHSLNHIHHQISVVIEKIRYEKALLVNNSIFKPWNIHTEYNPKTYVDLGEISLEDHVVLKSRQDVCNCFGYSGQLDQQVCIKHPWEDDTNIWFVRLYQHNHSVSEITADGLLITEKFLDDTHGKQQTLKPKDYMNKRIVFSRIKDNLSHQVMYRFMGMFTFDSETIETGIVWRRVSTTVKTYAVKE